MSRAIRRNKQRQKKFGFSHVIIAIMMIAVVIAAVLFYTDSFGFASSLRELLAVGSQEVVDADGLKIVDGDFTIDAPGDRLEDTHITGNLYLASGIGDGSVDLVNVKVDGSTLIQGGGINSIYMISCTFEELKVNRPEGRVRLIVSGETVIEKTILETGARLIENIKGDSAGFKSVEVMTDQQVDLIGSFDSIHVSVKDANVETTSEMLEQLVITKIAAGTALKYTDGLFIKNMYLDGTAYLVGRIEVDQAFLAASGITELNGSFNQVRITAEAGQFDIKEESTFNKLIVARDALNNELNLGENVTVASLELNEAV
ncbi:MAG: hypothetical protein MUP57_00830, partial [Clostridia bacterium]|nr:hypothetical protein [Clostridia bacterium]